MNKQDTSGFFLIMYDIRFRSKNSKYSEHLVCFLHSTPIFHNYQSLALPSAMYVFLISTIYRYILRNNSLCILFRTRTFKALNVKGPLVILIMAWGHGKLRKSQIQVLLDRDFRGKLPCSAQTQTFISQLALFQAALM